MSDKSAKRSALLVTTLSSFLTPFMASSINIALPSIGNEFKMDAVLLSWVASAYSFTGAIFVLPFGRIADIYGRKRIFRCGNALNTFVMLLMPFSVTPAFLISLRFLQGIAASMTYSTGLAVLISVFPPGERGRVLGINTATVYLGLSTGPFLGGLLTQYFGWRSLFISVIPLCFLILYCAFWKLEGEWAEAKGEGFDWPGSVVYSLSLLLIMYGFTLLPAGVGIGLVLIGFSGVGIFARWEARAKSPILNVGLFRNRVFVFSNVSALINYGSTFCVAFLLSLYLQYTKGLTPEAAGLVLVSQPLVQTICSPFSGRLSDRIEPRIVASTGMSFTAAGLFLLCLLNEKTSLLYVSMTLTLLGFGLALFSSPNVNSVMGSVEQKFFGITSAMLSTMRQGGYMLSMGMVTVIFSIYIGRVQITPEYYGLFLKSLKIAFFIAALLCVTGIFTSLSRGKKMRPVH